MRGDPQVERANQRTAAIKARARRDGYGFIKLIWSDPSHMRTRANDENGSPIYCLLAGVDIYWGTPFINEKTLRDDFFCEQRQGYARFVHSDIDGTGVCEMLDTDHNRDFLASHLTDGWWEIDADKDIIKDIEKRADRIREEAIQLRNKAIDDAEKLWATSRPDVDEKSGKDKREERYPPILDRAKAEKREVKKPERRGTLELQMPETSPRGMVKP